MQNKIQECLSCEKFFSIEDSLKDGVPKEMADTYCSSSCYTSFQRYLDDEAKSTIGTELNAQVEARTIGATEASELRKRFGIKLP